MSLLVEGVKSGPAERDGSRVDRQLLKPPSLCVRRVFDACVRPGPSAVIFERNLVIVVDWYIVCPRRVVVHKATKSILLQGYRRQTDREGLPFFCFVVHRKEKTSRGRKGHAVKRRILFVCFLLVIVLGEDKQEGRDMQSNRLTDGTALDRTMVVVAFLGARALF